MPGEERYDLTPEKNQWSHVHDALQYLLLGEGEHLEVTGRRERLQRQRNAQPLEEYDPLTWGG